MRQKGVWSNEVKVSDVMQWQREDRVQLTSGLSSEPILRPLFAAVEDGPDEDSGFALL